MRNFGRSIGSGGWAWWAGLSGMAEWAVKPSHRRGNLAEAWLAARAVVLDRVLSRIYNSRLRTGAEKGNLTV